MAAKVLLHICCGPCSIMPIKRLRAEGFEIYGFFHNPNIQPLNEYLRRRETAVQCAEKLDIPVIFDDSWNIEEWLLEQIPRLRSPSRCQWCCGYRLEKAMAAAQKLEMDYFSTTLLYSKYQPHEYLAARGKTLSQPNGPEFLYRDFRQDWQAGIDISKEWELYRQPYCGCIFSENERYAKKLARLVKAVQNN